MVGSTGLISPPLLHSSPQFLFRVLKQPLDCSIASCFLGPLLLDTSSALYLSLAPACESIIEYSLEPSVVDEFYSSNIQSVFS